MDTTIVKAAIFPPIGIARVGNSPDEFFIGPEVTAPSGRSAEFYKDASGALKRQAARFRVYGLNAAGIPIKELTADNARIEWMVEVANKKSAWYEFDVAMDVKKAVPVQLRNINIQDRESLMIKPSPKTISGEDKRGKEYAFDDGKFMGEKVYLGELQTDERGRLLFLGGHGVSNSPWPNNPPTTFANNNGWHDDISDGPVDAKVIYEDRELEVAGAWVVTAPPNYAPDLVGIQTMFDVIYNTMDAKSTGSAGVFLPVRPKPSFQQDILPILQQFSEMQWVNKGFFSSFGYQQNYDFTDERFLRRLSAITVGPNGKVDDVFQEDRRIIFNSLRKPNGKEIDPRLWPWFYGDLMGETDPQAYLALTPTLYSNFEKWMRGDFIQDYDPHYVEPRDLEELRDAAAQCVMLTKSALHYCLGGPFHPGCELTWPMRMAGMYSSPFRIRRRSDNHPEPEWGPVLDPAPFQKGAASTTPIEVFWNGPGDLTRWMAVPWQTDTASCRSGYKAEYDPYIPTFWPARVPNNVLSEKDYQIVMNTSLPREERLQAFNRRVTWFRVLGAYYLEQIDNMTRIFGDLGIVARKEGFENDPDFPAVMFVESVPFAPGGDGYEGIERIYKGGDAVASLKAVHKQVASTADGHVRVQAGEKQEVLDALKEVIDRVEAIPPFQGETLGAVGRGKQIRRIQDEG